MGKPNTDGRKVMKPISGAGGPPQKTGKPGSCRDRSDAVTRGSVPGIAAERQSNTAQGMKKSGGRTAVSTPTLNR